MNLYLYVPNVDAWHDRAIRAGAQPTLQPTDHAYGERGAGVTDEWGNFWYMATAVGAEFPPAEGINSLRRHSAFAWKKPSHIWPTSMVEHLINFT